MSMIGPAGTIPASSWGRWPRVESLTAATATFCIAVEMGLGVSDQDTDYLADDRYRFVYAVDMTLRPRESGTDEDLALSSIPFISGGSDDPADTAYDGALIQPLSFRRSIVNAGFSGLIEAAGEIEIDNSQGTFDDALSGRTTEDMPVTVRLGREGDALADFVTIHTGFCEVEELTRSRIVVPVRDGSRLFDVPLVEDVYAGTGGMEGGEDLAGKTRPLCLGFPENIQPPLLDRALNLFQVSAGPVQAIPAVYANGVRLYLDRDYATSTELIAASTTNFSEDTDHIDQGKFATCLAEGVFRLNYNLDGQIITCDVEGDNDAADGGFAGTVGEIVRKLATRAGKADFDEAAFERFESAHGYEAQGWFDVNDGSTIREAMERIAGFGVWFGDRIDGFFMIGRLEAPTGFPSIYVETIDILDDSGGLEKVPLPEGYNPPPWRIRVPWGENHTIQTGNNVAGSVSDERKQYLAQRHRFAVASNDDIKAASSRPRDREPVASSLRNAVDANAWAEHLLELLRDMRALWRVPLFREARVTDIGRVVHVTAAEEPELAAGVSMLVVDRDEDATTGRCSFVGFC